MTVSGLTGHSYAAWCIFMTEEKLSEIYDKLSDYEKKLICFYGICVISSVYGNVRSFLYDICN